MNAAKFRIYNPPIFDGESIRHWPASAVAFSPCSIPAVRVTVGQVLPLLADALASNRMWLHDFRDDAMNISEDLFEVLLAYQRHNAADQTVADRSNGCSARSAA